MDALIDIDIELLELGLAPEPQLTPDAIEYLVANDQEISPSPFQPIADFLPDDFRDGRDQIDERYMEFILATFDLEPETEAALSVAESKFITSDKPNFTIGDNGIPDEIPGGALIEHMTLLDEIRDSYLWGGDEIVVTGVRSSGGHFNVSFLFGSGSNAISDSRCFDLDNIVDTSGDGDSNDEAVIYAGGLALILGHIGHPAAIFFGAIALYASYVDSNPQLGVGTADC